MSGSFFWLLLEILDTETGLIQVKEQCCHTESQFMHPILCACSSGCVHVPAAGQPGSTGGCAVGGIPGGKSCWKNNNKKPFVRHFLYKQFIRFKQSVMLILQLFSFDHGKKRKSGFKKMFALWWISQRSSHSKVEPDVVYTVHERFMILTCYNIQNWDGVPAIILLTLQSI